MLDKLPVEDPAQYGAFLKWALSNPRGPVDPTLGVSLKWEARVADFDPPADSGDMLHYLGQLEAKRMLLRSLSTQGHVPSLTPRELIALIDFLRGTPQPVKKADLAQLSADEIVQLESLLEKARK